MRGAGRRAATGALAAAAALALGLVAGCGGGGEALSPRERSMRSTYEGRYQVKTLEDGKTRGVGVFDRGSFRIVAEENNQVIIYNRETEEGWLIRLAQRTYEPISREDALYRAGFMPDITMKAYFDLEQFWDGLEFRMDTSDGRSIRAGAGGPEGLPDFWRAEQGGRVLKEIRWEYRRVGEVSPANFQLPEGLNPRPRG
ncbi:MAG: hypothetical protein H5T74_05700 [Actinobacteria bacterium]|nr:hypothetical protein [Actinomycetota bacterium]MDI6830745.1 hypothetical protein [Actinomycetota bacterium]